MLDSAKEFQNIGISFYCLNMLAELSFIPPHVIDASDKGGTCDC